MNKKILSLFNLFIIFLFVFSFVYADNEIDLLNIGNEKNLQNLEKSKIYPQTILDETPNFEVYPNFLNLDKNFVQNNFSTTPYKPLFITNKNWKKIYQFNKGLTQVINNQEKTKNILELELSIAETTEYLFLAFDNLQSNQLPDFKTFLEESSSTIKLEKLPKYVKLEKTKINNNLLLLDIEENISDFSIQIIELEESQNITGIYNSNILQLNNIDLEEYFLFQINKNLVSVFCKDCVFKDYGFNENGFYISNKATNLNEETIIENLKKKENVCLTPDGSEISGFTNEAYEIFGFDKLYFEWNTNSPSDFYDYGRYYVDEDQFRVAVSKKLEEIKNGNYIILNNIKYKKSHNSKIQKVDAYLEHDLKNFSINSTNKTINDSISFTISALNALPEEYKKLTIIDIINLDPTIEEKDFESMIIAIFNDNYYKTESDLNHYQVTLESFINSIENIKKIKNKSIKLSFLYNLTNLLNGFDGVYFSEGLDYFIYNLKSITDLEESKKILKNEYTKLLGNYWEIEIDNLAYNEEPETVVFNLSKIEINNKKANFTLNKPKTKLLLDYFSNNFYYSNNFFFYNSINALSYNRGEFFNYNTRSSEYKIPIDIDDFDILQNGLILDYDYLEKNYEISTVKPIIIIKNIGEDITIKYFNGRDYKNYPIDDIKSITYAYDFFSLKEMLVVYNFNAINDYPLIIESKNSLIFTEEASVSYENNKYIYKIYNNNNQLNIKDLINDILKEKNCFLISKNKIKIWENIDQKLNIRKEEKYSDFLQNLNIDEKESNYRFLNTALPTTNIFAIVKSEESQDIYNKLTAVKTFVDSQKNANNLKIFKNYSLAYEELTKSNLELKNNSQIILSLLDCKEQVVCDVNYNISENLNIKIPNCIDKSSSSCFSFWSNPKINNSTTFAVLSAKHFYNYDYDLSNIQEMSSLPNNRVIWETKIGSLPKNYYDYLIPGSLLAIKIDGFNNLENYNHMVVYLGKLGSDHYITHLWYDHIKVEKLDVFLKTTARINTCLDKEDGEIKKIFISNNLYNQLKEKSLFLDKPIDSELSSLDNSVPSFILDSIVSSNFINVAKKTQTNTDKYAELEKVYNNILNKTFDTTYYKYIGSDELDKAYEKGTAEEFSKKVKLDPNKPMIIILGKYKKIFLVKKNSNNETKILLEYSISTGANGFGCEVDSYKTPVGLFKIVEKQGKECQPLQIITSDGCLFNNNKPVLAKHNSAPVKIVTRKFIIDGLERTNIGLNCEKGNRNSIIRGIQIHGTNMENSIGLERTGGCIRMRNDDIITLFDQVNTETYVYIYNTDTTYAELLDIETELLDSSKNNTNFSLASTKTIEIIRKDLIDFLNGNYAGCLTSDPEYLKLLRTKNYNLVDKENTKRTASSIVVTSKPSISYADLSTKILAKNSTGYAPDPKVTVAIPTLYNLCALYNIDPIFVLTLFKSEKSMYNMNSGNYNKGALSKSNNPSGIKATGGCVCGGKNDGYGFCSYPTLDAGFEATLINLTKIYKNLKLSTGSKSNVGVAEKWNPDGTPRYGKELVSNINGFYNLIK